MNKLFATVFSILIYSVSYAQELISDTIVVNDTRIILKHPQNCVVQDFPYEEGTIKTLNFKNGNISIFCGTMVKLPLVSTKEIKIDSEFKLFNDVRIIRGVHKWGHFREDDFIKYGISILYQSVSEEEVPFYENILNSAIIEKIK
ncbi:MAG: hypothetical protein IKP37_11750 [Paludibacteraceae bacterium]|nr:hypothetical protein [Paludibacteraceae bacterium]